MPGALPAINQRALIFSLVHVDRSSNIPGGVGRGLSPTPPVVINHPKQYYMLPLFKLFTGLLKPGEIL
jgi:hypothetical protein